MKKTVKEVQNEALLWYCGYLDKLEKEITDEYELMSYCMLAGRLASLDRGEYVTKADALLSNQSYSESVDDMFADRIHQINFELEDLTGKDLGVTISELQDLYCFFIYTSYPFSDSLRDYLDETVKDSEHSDISFKTIKFIRRYRKIYPIKKKDAIPTVKNPQSPILLEIEAAAMPYKRTVFTTLYQNNEWLVKTDRYTLHLRVTDNSADKKTFESFLTHKDKKYPASDIVFSHGRVYAVQNRENPLLWTLDYSLFPSLDCNKQNDLPLKITMPLGGQAEIPNPFTVISVVKKTKADSLAEHRRFQQTAQIAAASNENKEDCYLNVEGAESELSVRVLRSENRVSITACKSSNRSELSSEFDGWTICDAKGNELAKIHDFFASFSIDSNPDLLIDSNPVQFIILFIILKDSQGAEKQLTVVPEKMQ